MRNEGAVAIAFLVGICTAGCAGQDTGQVSEVTTVGASATGDQPSPTEMPAPATPADPTTGMTPSDPAPTEPGPGTGTWQVEASGTTDPIVGVWGAAAND